MTASAHAGTAALNYGRKGHIRGSVNVPYPALLAEDGRLRPVAELRQAFDAVGILFEALKRAGPNATRAQVRDALAATANYPGVTGTTTLTHSDVTPLRRSPIRVAW